MSPRLFPVVLSGATAFLGLYAICYYIGGSAGGSLPALFWARWGWTACVLLVVAVQLAIAVVSIGCWADVREATDASGRAADRIVYGGFSPEWYHHRLWMGE